MDFISTFDANDMGWASQEMNISCNLPLSRRLIHGLGSLY